MEIFTLFEVIALLIFTISSLNHYSAKDVHFISKFLIFIGWFLSFVMIAILPLDVYYTINEQKPSVPSQPTTPYSSNSPTQLNYDTMISVWNFLYWGLFFWTWIVLPIVAEYSEAGDFTFKERMKTSIKMNGYYYGLMALGALLFLIYMVSTGRIGSQGIIQFCINFANIFGVIQIVLCMGYGLVFVPRRCFQMTNNSLNLKYYQYQTSVVNEQRNNAQFEVDELIRLIITLRQRKDVCSDYFNLLDLILEECPKDMVKNARENMPVNHRSSKLNEYTVLSYSKITDLNKQMKKKINELRRVEIKWEILLKNSFFLEDVIDSEHSIEYRIRSAFYIERRGKIGKLLDHLEWFWYTRLRMVAFFILGIIAIIFSIAVLLLEVLTFEEFNLVDTSFFSKEDSFMKTQFICLILMLYISICCYSALFNVKIFSLYGLYPHHQTDTYSLVFCATNFSRISGPLIFNFLQMMKIKNTAFNAVMGDAGIAYSFTTYFPIILILLCVCSLFDVYGKLFNLFGLGKYQFDEEGDDEDKIEDGKKLLYRARNNKERIFLVMNSTNLRSYQNYQAKLKLKEYDSIDPERGNKKIKLHDLMNGEATHLKSSSILTTTLEESTTPGTRKKSLMKKLSEVMPNKGKAK